jgi:hypothetical protein
MQPANEYDVTIDSIEALIEDPAFHDLKRRLSESTLFDVLGIAFEERTHSRMLGWLLDPSESHGLETVLLRKFLYKAAKRARGLLFDCMAHPMTPLEAETWTFSDMKIEREYPLPNARRPDIVLWSARGEMALRDRKQRTSVGSLQGGH